MKILCLHGSGTSGAIFESQLAQFLDHVDESYEFVFIDGEVECAKAPGIPLTSAVEPN